MSVIFKILSSFLMMNCIFSVNSHGASQHIMQLEDDQKIEKVTLPSPIVYDAMETDIQGSIEQRFDFQKSKTMEIHCTIRSVEILDDIDVDHISKNAEKYRIEMLQNTLLEFTINEQTYPSYPGFKSITITSNIPFTTPCIILQFPADSLAEVKKQVGIIRTDDSLDMLVAMYQGIDSSTKPKATISTALSVKDFYVLLGGSEEGSPGSFFATLYMQKAITPIK